MSKEGGFEKNNKDEKPIAVKIFDTSTSGAIIEEVPLDGAQVEGLEFSGGKLVRIRHHKRKVPKKNEDI